MNVSSYAQTQQVTQNLLQLQNQGNTLSEEISSGIKSQNYSGYASQAAQLVNLSATASQQQSYINTINSVNTRLSSMTLATSTITTLVQQFTSQFPTNAYNTSGATVQSQAQGLLAQIGDYLNTQDGEGYIFSGSETATAPFDSSGLPNPGNLTSSVSGAPPSGYYAGNDDVNQARIDSNLNVSYGITADNPAFEQVIRVLNFVANSPGFTSGNATDTANVNTAEQMLSSATNQLNTLTAQIGTQQSELNSVLQAHQSTQTLATGTISDIENVDPSTVITQLDSLQTQLEASYQSVNILQNLTLANYLK